MATVRVKQNDRRPVVVATLTDSTGGAIDLSTASGVKFVMKSATASTAKIDTAATITTATDGIVTYSWAAGDTDTTGTYDAEFEIDWGSNIYETIPTKNYLTVEVIDDLGGDI